MLVDDRDPIAPLTLAYRFLLAEGISTLTWEQHRRMISISPERLQRQMVPRPVANCLPLID